MKAHQEHGASRHRALGAHLGLSLLANHHARLQASALLIACILYYITNLIATGMMSIEAPDCEMCQVTNIMMSCHIKYINSPPRTQVKRRLTDVYRWALLVSICTSS